MNALVQSFLGELEQSVKFCHFKSNNNLAQALNCIGDLDLIVDQNDFSNFFAVSAKWGFRLAKDQVSFTTPSVFHLFGVDFDTQKLVHLHVYFKLVTGGSLFKNYRVPLEAAFLDNIRRLYDTPIPSQELDLILFVLRKFLEQPSLLEHYLFFRDRHNIAAELAWLKTDLDHEALKLAVATHLPFFPLPLFFECLEALSMKNSLLRRVRLGRRVRRYFPEIVMPEWKASLFRLKTYARAFWKARTRSDRNFRYLLPGGCIIAFIGSEASGKSTLSRSIASWYGRAFDVKHVHLGKPQKSLATRPFWIFIALYSKIKKMIRRLTNNWTQKSDSKDEAPQDFMPHPVVLVLDAYDRYRATVKCSKAALNGWIIVTDRYPSANGGVDGPRIQPDSRISKLLCRLEKKYYAKVPLPDVVFKVGAPLDVTLERNNARAKPEPEDFIRQRFVAAKAIKILDKNQHYIDTTESQEACLEFILKKLWHAL